MTASLTAVAKLNTEMQVKPRTAFALISFSQNCQNIARLLMATHKDLSQARHNSLPSSLARDFCGRSHAQQFESVDSSEFLFGTDLAKKAEQISKSYHRIQRLISNPRKINMEWSGNWIHLFSAILWITSSKPRGYGSRMRTGCPSLVNSSLV